MEDIRARVGDAGADAGAGHQCMGDGNDLSEETERRGSAWRAPPTCSEG